MTGWTVADELWQADIIMTKTEYSVYLKTDCYVFPTSKT